MSHRSINSRYIFFITLFSGAMISFPPFRPVYGEIIIYKNGSQIEGRILSQSRSEVVVQTGQGVQKVLKSDLKMIQWVSKTDAQKKAEAEVLREKREAERMERERIEKETLEEEEKRRQLQELETQIQAEKAEQAKIRAERAEALRELVETEKMEKPKDEPISYWDFAWRSMVLPGWGHFTIERRTMGSIYAGTAAALLYNLHQRDRDVRHAMNQNHQDALVNYALAILPGAVPVELKVAVGYFSNGKAITQYQKKVDRANYAVYLLQAFYGLQLLHIIYNGFAWEKGLLIVNDDSRSVGVTPNLAVAPDIGEDGKIGGALRAGITFRF